MAEEWQNRDEPGPAARIGDVGAARPGSVSGTGADVPFAMMRGLSQYPIGFG